MRVESVVIGQMHINRYTRGHPNSLHKGLGRTSTHLGMLYICRQEKGGSLYRQPKTSNRHDGHTPSSSKSVGERCSRLDDAVDCLGREVIAKLSSRVRLDLVWPLVNFMDAKTTSVPWT